MLLRCFGTDETSNFRFKEMYTKETSALYWAVPCHAVPCRAVTCCAVPCCDVPCPALPCCAWLRICMRQQCELFGSRSTGSELNKFNKQTKQTNKQQQLTKQIPVPSWAFGQHLTAKCAPQPASGCKIRGRCVHDLVDPTLFSLLLLLLVWWWWWWWWWFFFFFFLLLLSLLLLLGLHRKGRDYAQSPYLNGKTRCRHETSFSNKM